MSTREDLSQFETPASRALVDQFMAETVDEDNDVDMNEVVQQNLADHEAALSGEQPDPQPDVVALLKREAEHIRQEAAAADSEAALADLKRRMRLKNPKPVTGYLVTSDPDDYTANPKRGWFFLPPLNCTIKGAQDRQVGFQAMAPASPPKPMYKVTITFERVEDGDDG